MRGSEYQVLVRGRVWWAVTKIYLFGVGTGIALGYLIWDRSA